MCCLWKPTMLLDIIPLPVSLKCVCGVITTYNPFTPQSDQCQNSPAASQEIWHHTVWRTWLFIAYSDEKWLYYKFSLHHSYNRFLKGWENTLFELRSEKDNMMFHLGELLYAGRSKTPQPARPGQVSSYAGQARLLGKVDPETIKKYTV